MEPWLERRSRPWIPAVFAASAVVGIGLFLIPAFVIRPFRYQSPRALWFSLALRQHAAWGTLVGAAVCIGLALATWTSANKWGKTLLAAALVLVAFSAVMATSLEVVEEADFTTAAWRKLLSNVAANPITALTSRRLGVLRDTGVRVLASTLLAEAISVGVAEGAESPTFTPTPC